MGCDKSGINKFDLVLNILKRAELKYKIDYHKQDDNLEFIIYKDNDKAIYHFSDDPNNYNKLNKIIIKLSEDDDIPKDKIDETILSAIYDLICETKQFYIIRYTEDESKMVFSIPSFKSTAELQIKLNLMG